MIGLPRYIPLSLPRKWMCDFVHFASKSPAVGGTILIQVGDLMKARARHQPMISWGAILIKTIALAADKWPELRRAYMPLPWPHLYEHPYSVATVVVERKWRNEAAVFCDQIKRPNEKSLSQIDFDLRTIKHAKVESLGAFRRLIRTTKYPLLLRRLMWRIALQGSGRLKAKYFGTFSINAIIARRVYPTQAATPLTFSVYYGPAKRDGEMPLHIFFDHRVIDASFVSRMGPDFEAILNGEILAELEGASPTFP